MITTKGKNSAMCGGDSGGPLFQYNNRGQLTVVGTVSGALVECGEEQFGVCPIRARAQSARSMKNIAPSVQSNYKNRRSWYSSGNQGQRFNYVNDFNQQSNWNYLNYQNNNGILYSNQLYSGIYSDPWANPYYSNQQSYPNNYY
ncbi:hypothetical protein ANCCAN_18216 [Ancylostoma caninum]|uniref:Peptidase S1 domain-containing protein n=1 Tax=Ancylostoma caninum TaxID=29170 RepID=A0A368FUY5_ANCCA|nr:hypothetical protein ANCCAN_18216 [Ancylostoma caninum]